MSSDRAAAAFAALAQTVRLDVFRMLVRAGPSGMPAGAIAAAMQARQNTMSTNLSVLASAGLVRARRDGRRVIYAADMDGMRALLAFLMEECCGGAPEACRPILDMLVCEDP